ncbi:MAG: endonuclease/exonuclease/phosphatase family protein, partial [Anaerolineales bacterium]
LALDPGANLVVLGDLNDFQWSPPLDTLTAGGGLHILINTLPENERYSYNFDANAQVLDHILLSDNLFDHALAGFDVVHVNSEFAENLQASDHDPSLVRLSLAGADLGGSAKAVNTTSALAGGLLTYTLTLSNSGGSTAFFVLTDTLNANVALVTAPGLTGTSTLTATGTLAPGAQQMFTVTVQISGAFSGTLTNTAQLSGDGAVRDLPAPAVTVATPPSPANFSDSSKTVSATTALAGGLLTYTLAISNSGQVTATYRLTDVLDANLTLVSAPGLTGSGTLTATGLLAGHAQQTFVVTVRAAQTFSGTIHNTALLSGDGQTRSLNAPAVSVSPFVYRFYLPFLIRR